MAVLRCRCRKLFAIHDRTMRRQVWLDEGRDRVSYMAFDAANEFHTIPRRTSKTL
jgi:hypothetical protein